MFPFDKVLHIITLLHTSFNFENIWPTIPADLSMYFHQIAGIVFAALFVSQHYEYC